MPHLGKKGTLISFPEDIQGVSGTLKTIRWENSKINQNYPLIFSPWGTQVNIQYFICFVSHYSKKTASIPKVSSNNTSPEQILACEFTFLLSNLTLQNLVVFIFFEHKKWQSTKFCRVRFGSKNLNLKVKLGLIDVLLIETLGIWVVFAILIHILFQEAY